MAAAGHALVVDWGGEGREEDEAEAADDVGAIKVATSRDTFFCFFSYWR